MSTRKPATIAVRTGIESDTQHHAVVPPIYLSTNYASQPLVMYQSTITPAQATQTAGYSKLLCLNLNQVKARS